MEIISRGDAAMSGKRHYFTGRPCAKGHISTRYTSTGNCTACQKGYAMAYGETLKRVYHSNFDQRKAELLYPAIHVPPHRHEEIYQFIDYVLATEGRPPCPRPTVVAPAAPMFAPGLTKWEQIYTVQFSRGIGHERAHYVASLGGLSEFPHSEGWVFPGAASAAPTPAPEHLGGNKPDYL